MNQSPDEIKKLLRAFFETQRDIAAVYLFGSLADASAHATSDVDVAVLLKKGLGDEAYVDQQLFLGGKLCEVLGRDDVDLVVLNRATSSELKFSIVHDGELLLDREPNLAEYELRIEREYYDHMAALRRAGF